MVLIQNFPKKFDQPFYKLMLYFFYCMHAKELRSIFPYLAQEMLCLFINKITVDFGNLKSTIFFIPFLKAINWNIKFLLHNMQLPSTYQGVKMNPVLKSGLFRKQLHFKIFDSFYALIRSSYILSRPHNLKKYPS